MHIWANVSLFEGVVVVLLTRDTKQQKSKRITHISTFFACEVAERRAYYVKLN